MPRGHHQPNPTSTTQPQPNILSPTQPQPNPRSSTSTKHLQPNPTSSTQHPQPNILSPTQDPQPQPNILSPTQPKILNLKPTSPQPNLTPTQPQPNSTSSTSTKHQPNVLNPTSTSSMQRPQPNLNLLNPTSSIQPQPPRPNPNVSDPTSTSSTQPQCPQPNLNPTSTSHRPAMAALRSRYQQPPSLSCTSSARRKRRRSCRRRGRPAFPGKMPPGARDQGVFFFWPLRPRRLSPSYFWRRMCKGTPLPAAGAASKPASHQPAPAVAGIAGHTWPLDIAPPAARDKLRDTRAAFARQPTERHRGRRTWPKPRGG